MTSGQHAYNISQTKENLIGKGASGDVYKIYSKNDRKVYAAKFYRRRIDFMDSKE